jgi:glycerophosphoryl diester phosphodiesterase
MSTQDLQAWPYPYWIAHRGAGKLAPENTLAAFRLGASLGHTCFECDVKLSSDDQAFLLHDADLKRTTDREGVAGALPWAALAKLDAGQWHSANHAGEPLPTLERIAGFIQRNGYTINLEIKPTPGTALHARQSAPTLPRALLLDSWWDGWSDTAAHLGCVAIVCNHRILDAAMMAQARRVVQRVLVYTVNLDADVQRMRDVGVDGVITDAVDRYGQAR